MRDPLITRRLLAKIDRDADVFVILDRMRQAIYDESDYAGSLEKRIKILEDAERNRITDTGVVKAIDAKLNERTAQFGGKLFWALLTIVGMLIVAAMSWLGGMVFKGMHTT